MWIRIKQAVHRFRGCSVYSRYRYLAPLSDAKLQHSGKDLAKMGSHQVLRFDRIALGYCIHNGSMLGDQAPHMLRPAVAHVANAV